MVRSTRGRKRAFVSLKKRIARHPHAHKECHYRCFLPDLTGFVILYCTGPGYHTDDHVAVKREKLPLVTARGRIRLIGQNCSLFGQAYILFLARGVKKIHGGEWLTPPEPAMKQEHRLPTVVQAECGAELQRKEG